MNAFQNTTVIVTGTVVATGLTSLKQLLEGKLSMRPIIGGFVVGTVLLISAFFNTEIASALALLLLVTSVLNNGIPILEKVMNAAS